MTFAEELKAQLEAKPKRSAKEERILEMIAARPSKRRTRRLNRMEQHARIELGDKAPAGDDWSEASFDWSAFLQVVLKVLTTLLPLILAL